MIERKSGGISWLEFEQLAECPLVHGCFNRRGGVSTGTLDSLNLGRSCGDDPKNVDENKRRVMKALGIDHLVIGKGNHGDKTISVNALTDAEMSIADGISTNVPGISLGITQADCQAAIFYDPVKHAFANVHCGWRGNVQDIFGKTVEYMRGHYGSNPKDLLVCVSPSLGPESSEFVNYRKELPESFLEFQFKPTYFDLWEISRWQLKNAGVLPHHIEIAGIDTFADDDYFSYRRDKACGRQATICCLQG